MVIKTSAALLILVSFLMLGPANAQDSIECILFGCDTPEPEPEPEPEPTDDTASNDDSSTEEPSCALGVPDSASATGRARSSKGIDTANEARGCSS